MEPDHKAVIVTGAASGIGLAMTMGLIRGGHDVTAVDRNAAALAELTQASCRARRERADGRRRSRTPGQFRACHRRGPDPIRTDRCAGEQRGHRPSLGDAGRSPADPLLGNHARAMGPLHRGQCRGADQHGARRAAAHAGGEARRIVTVTTSLGTMVREGYLLYGSSKAAAEVGDGGAGGGSGRHRRDVERAGAGRHHRHAAGGRWPRTATRC